MRVHHFADGAPVLLHVQHHVRLPKEARRGGTQRRRETVDGEFATHESRRQRRNVGLDALIRSVNVAAPTVSNIAAPLFGRPVALLTLACADAPSDP